MSCYYGDGSVASTMYSCNLDSTETNYTSACCAYGEGCAANGMCYANTRGVVYLGGCQNSDWTGCNMKTIATKDSESNWTDFGWTNFYWCNYEWWTGNTSACTVCQTSDDCSKGTNGLLFDGPSEDKGWNIKGYAGISSSATSTASTSTATSTSSAAEGSCGGTSDAVKIVAIVVPCLAVVIISILLFVFFNRRSKPAQAWQPMPLVSVPPQHAQTFPPDYSPASYVGTDPAYIRGNIGGLDINGHAPPEVAELAGFRHEARTR